jgi:hypothetical protein
MTKANLTGLLKNPATSFIPQAIIGKPTKIIMPTNNLDIALSIFDILRLL